MKLHISRPARPGLPAVLAGLGLWAGLALAPAGPAGGAWAQGASAPQGASSAESAGHATRTSAHPTPWPDTFTLERVAFEGTPHPALGDAELQALAAPFVGRPLRALDVEELRQRITRLCVERGFVNSGAWVADDALRGRTLHVRLVTGRVTELRARGLDGLDTAYLQHRLPAPGTVLDVNHLQDRFQLLVTDPLFDRVNVRLLPGQALGQAVLDVDVARSPVWQATLFSHNQGAVAVGSAVGGAELGARNLTGWGDAVAATLSRSRGSEGYDLAWTLPLRASRTWLTLHGSRSNASVVEEPVRQLGVSSRTLGHDVTLGHPFVDTLRQRAALGLTWAQREHRAWLDGEPFSFVPGVPEVTRVESWRLFHELTLRNERQVLALRLAYAQGRSNVPAVADLPGLPAGRYRLWQLQAQGSTSLGDAGAQLMLRAAAQHSPQHLVPLEQLSIGGRQTVRGYRENQLVRDNGWALSIEAPWPLLGGEGARRRLSLVPFIDAGAARNAGSATQRLSSVGLGVQGRFDELEAEIFYARRLDRRPADTHGDLQDHGIHLALRWHTR